MKLLNDVVFSCKPISEEDKNEIKYVSTGGMRAVVTRGGPLDLAFHHTDSNRLKMTIEMYVSFSEKGIKLSGIKNENMFLMIRTLGCTESRSSSSPVKNSIVSPSSLLESFTASDVMWSLCVDKDGSLIFSMGNNLKSPSNSMKNTVKSGPKCVSFEDIISLDDEDEDRITPTWSHIVAVVDSSSNYENDSTDNWPLKSSITLYVNGEKVAQDDVDVPVLKEEELSVQGVLYVCPCLPGGTRITEIRMVRYTKT